MPIGHRQGGCQCPSCVHRRAYQNEYRKNRYHADPEYKARMNARTDRWQKANAERMVENARAWRRAKGIGPWSPKPVSSRVCSMCGVTFMPPRRPSGYLSERRTCSDECAVVKNREALRRGAETIQRRVQKASEQMTCPITYATCEACDSVFIKHGPRWKYCPNEECAIERRRTWQREYQRRTKVTAIRYWRVAPTPEAEALAKEYYELRQALRQVRRQGVPTS